MNRPMPTLQPQPRKRIATHTFAERKRVVELYQTGLGSKRIARALDLDDSTVRQWLRKYRTHGLEALRPYWRETKQQNGLRAARREENERTFQPAFTAYATTLEPVASITRRYGIDYQSFVYHIRRYHPELVERRKQLSVNYA